MNARRVLMLSLLLALAVARPGVGRAEWDDRPDPSEYEEALSPHGYWADDAQLGRVWRPYEGWDWRPYVDGQWVWTSYGWTWVSAEPWAWTFHYGRWGFSNLNSWVWVPGYVWGPAWVDWYWGDGFVGWAPLGPTGVVVIPSYWNYVRDSHFCAPHLNTVVVQQRFVPDYIVHHRDQGWGRQHAPGLRDIELVSRHQIVRDADRPGQTIAPWVQHRVDRGEHVRERVADQGGERVIEHGPRRSTPPVADDGGWRHGKPGGDDQAGHGHGRDDDRQGRGRQGDADAPGLPGRPTRIDPGDGGRSTFVEPRRRNDDDRDVGRPRGGQDHRDLEQLHDPHLQHGWTGQPRPSAGSPPMGQAGGHPRGGGTMEHGGGGAPRPAGPPAGWTRGGGGHADHDGERSGSPGGSPAGSVGQAAH